MDYDCDRALLDPSKKSVGGHPAISHRTGSGETALLNVRSGFISGA